MRRAVSIGLIAVSLGLTILYAEIDIRFGSSADVVNHQSDGSFMDTSFTFELGSFDSGFTPNASNTDLWSSNWTAVPGDSSADYTQTPVIVFTRTGASNNFAGTVNLANNDSPFSTTDQAYIWGFDDRGDSGTGEWILLTNSDWMYPATVEGETDLSGGVDFQVSDAGTVAVLGSVNPEFANVGDAPHMISASVTLLPVPEPSVGLLALGALGIALVRRRR